MIFTTRLYQIIVILTKQYKTIENIKINMIILKNINIKSALLLLMIAIAVYSSISCASSPAGYGKVDNAVEQDDFSLAVEQIKKGQEGNVVIYPEKNVISLYLDKGLLEHYAGNYAQSSEDLQNAERLIEEAYTKSISQGFLTYIINDNTRDYPGEDFENIYLNIFNALNYYNRGNIEGALVEIRKLSMNSGKLDLLARRYDYRDPETGYSLSEKINKDTGVRQMPETKSVNFSNSALARFLCALFYQADGNEDSARIEFEQIPRAFSANTNLYRHRIPFAIEQAQNVPEGKVRLNVLTFTGLSPVKEEQLILHDLPFRHPVLQITSLKLPVLIERPNKITRVEVIVEGEESFNLELLEDIGLVIQETYNARFSNILLKTYIRTIIKYTVADIAAMEVSRSQNELAGLLVAISARVALDASERADIRMSRYLPSKSYIGGINLDPGTYSVIINYYSGNNIITYEQKDVTVSLNGLNLLQTIKLK